MKSLSEDILKQTLKYNPYIKYEEGDDIYTSQTLDINSWSEKEKEYEYKGYLEEYIRQNHPTMVSKDITYNKNSLYNHISYVQTKIIDITSSDVLLFKNVILKSALETDKNYLKTIYYSDTDTLVISKKIYDGIADGNITKLKITCFNMKTCKHNYTIFKEFERDYKDIDVEFKFIPETIKQKLLLKDCGYTIDDDRAYVMFKNVNIDDIEIFPIMSYNIMYDIDTGSFSFDGSNFVKMNVLCKDIAENGLDFPIILYLVNNTLLAMGGITQYLCCKYLGMDEIPICVIKTYVNRYCEYEVKKHLNPTKDTIQKILFPYILLD